jgi:tRNA (guanine37-N1)-methyltransferase
MIMKVEPLVHGLEQLRTDTEPAHDFDVPSGHLFTQQRARNWRVDALLFVCGRYGGVDDRVRAYVDEEVSMATMC